MSIDWRSYKLRLRMGLHGQWRKHHGSDMSISLFNALLYGPVLRVASLLNGNLFSDALSHSDNILSMNKLDSHPSTGYY